MRPSGPEPAQPRLEILLLCEYKESSAGAIVDHIHAFPRFSRHRVRVLSFLGDLPEGIALDRFDCVIVHYSLIVSHDTYLSPATRSRLRAWRGFKAVFVQDDYRWIDATVSALAYMRINALFPLTRHDIMEQVYPTAKLLGVRKETVLPGYVPEALLERRVPPLRERPLDVGYRARKLPAWMGEHTLQKWQIADRFAEDARRLGLKTDISWREEDRIYGEAWIDFVTRCKAMLGTESGTSVCDFTGGIQRNVERHLRRHPGATFEELRRIYFADVDGRIRMFVISPRCFEAAALRTLMVLYEGDYFQVLEPWRHYVPLARDHSNVDEVARIIRDPALAEPIVERAHREIALNPRYSYRALVELVDRVIEEEFEPRMRAAGRPYADEEFDWARRPQTVVRLLEPRSALAFHDGYGLDPVVRGPAHEDYAAALEGQPLPHGLDARLARPARPGLVSIDWGDARNSAASFTVQCLLDGRVTAERQVTGSRSAHVDVPLGQPEADSVRITVREYNGIPSLLLRQVRVYAPPPGDSLAQKISRGFWRMFPAALRSRLGPALLPMARKLRLHR